MKLIIINGPNLNLLGTREPEQYGEQNFEAFFKLLTKRYSTISCDYFQSNIEGELISKIQEAQTQYDGIILNAAAYTHTSVGIGDAVKAISIPVVEVHISNIYKREAFRHQSYVAAHAAGIIVGFGLEGYSLAIAYFIKKNEALI